MVPPVIDDRSRAVIKACTKEYGIVIKGVAYRATN